MTQLGRPSPTAWYVTAAVLVATTAWSAVHGSASASIEADQRIVAEAKELRLRARTLHERGELGEAIDVASRAAEIAPTDPRSRAMLRAMQTLTGRTREACARRASCIIRAAGDPTGCRGEPK